MARPFKGGVDRVIYRTTQTGETVIAQRWTSSSRSGRVLVLNGTAGKITINVWGEQ